MLARLLVLTALVASVAGHGGFFGPGHFGGGSEERLAYPLDSTSGGPDKTFFRGLSPKNAQGPPTQLKAGGKATLTIGCDQFPFQQDKSKFCPGDLGSLHSANGKRSGCALAISYKPFDQINGPDDMKVFSVLADCPHVDSAHVFEIPANLPATPKGKPATCLWSWVPSAEASADEQYQTGFTCEVSSSTPVGSTILDAKPIINFGVQGAPKANPRPLYNDLFKAGAQKFNVKSSGAVADKPSAASGKSDGNGKSNASAKSASKASVNAANVKPASKCGAKARRSVDLASRSRSRARRSAPPHDDVHIAQRDASHRRSRPIR